MYVTVNNITRAEKCWKSQVEASRASTQQGTSLFSRVTLGAGPASKHESNLVDKVRNVVDHVEEGLVHCSEQVAEQVARRVDGPANCDNQAHCVEGSSHSLAATSSSATGFTSEDFEQNERPARP